MREGGRERIRIDSGGIACREGEPVEFELGRQLRKILSWTKLGLLNNTSLVSKEKKRKVKRERNDGKRGYHD